MIKINPRHIFLYIIGIVLLVFGYPSFWTEIKEENKKKEETKRMQEDAQLASTKKFEIQQAEFDSLTKQWKNKTPYFQTIHVGKVNFKAVLINKKTSIETNDDENASDSF